MTDLDPSTLPDDAKADLRALAKQGLKLTTEKRRSRVQVYLDADDSWRWRFMSGNGRVLADSGQGYTRRIDCMRALEIVTASRVDSEAGHLYRQRVGWGVEYVHIEVIP